MNFTHKSDDTNEDELRRSFLKGTISPDTERKLLDSAQLRRSLLGTPVSDEVRRVIVNGQLSSHLRAKLISEIIQHSGPTPTPSRGPISQPPKPVGSPLNVANVSKGSSGIPASTLASTADLRDSLTGPNKPPSLSKRAFTAKRTNRPERPLPQAAVSPKPPLLEPFGAASRAGTQRVLGSGISLELVKITSDTVAATATFPEKPNPSNKSSGDTKRPSSSSASTGPFSAATPSSNPSDASRLTTSQAHQILNNRPQNEVTIATSHEKNLKRKRDKSSSSDRSPIIHIERSPAHNQLGVDSLSSQKNPNQFVKTNLKPSSSTSKEGPANNLTSTCQDHNTALGIYGLCPNRPSNFLQTTDDRIGNAAFRLSGSPGDSAEETGDGSLDMDRPNSADEDSTMDDWDSLGEDGNDSSNGMPGDITGNEVGETRNANASFVDPASTTETEWVYNLWTCKFFPSPQSHFMHVYKGLLNITASSGEKQPTGGALIPKGYKLHDDPHCPWICPIRSCRTLFTRLWGLGAHFSRAHRAWLLNDNEDGTLSLVRKINANGTRAPAKIISKQPLDPKEPPMARPSVPHSSSNRLLNDAASSPSPAGGSGYEVSNSGQLRASVFGSSLTNQAALTPTPTLLSTEGILGETGTMLWKYIQPLLTQTPLSPIPRRGHVPELLQCLTRVRDIQLNPDTQFPYNEKRDQDIAAMIIQAAGREAERPCKRCQQGKGPFLGCIVLPPHAPLSVRRSILGCANCFYKCNQTYCDLKKWSLKTYPELTSSHIPQQDMSAKPAALLEPACPVEIEKQLERRSMRIVLKELAAVSTLADDTTQRAERVSKNRHPSIPPSNSQHSSHNSSGGNFVNGVRDGAGTFSNGYSSTINPAQMLELETWEVAPGRIHNEESDTTDNFAFSNAYLAQNQAVRIGRDISFQVITIKPGTVYNWEASGNKLRLCSVASGKLQIKMHGQEFPMGPNGMIKIKPGVDCTAMNKLYIDAMVHVTVVPGDLCG
ncbi:hypothetical protein AAE478_000035 [Parahypoxylon ruwenzoriense]